MNQKWETFKQELKHEVDKQKKNEYNHNLFILCQFIKLYTDKEIKYSSHEYDEISKKLTELNLRTQKEKSVYSVLKSNRIHVKYINDGIIILGDDKNE